MKTLQGIARNTYRGARVCSVILMLLHLIAATKVTACLLIANGVLCVVGVITDIICSYL